MESHKKNDTIAVHTGRNWRHYIIAPLLMLYLFSFSLAYTTLPQYAYFSVQKMLFPNTTINSTAGEQSLCDKNKTEAYHQQQTIQKTTAKWDIYCSIAVYVPAVVTNLIYCSYSDRYGRRLFFIIPMIGTFLKCLLCAIGVYLDFSIYIFIAFYGIEGLTGTWINLISISYTYVCDLTKPGKTRTFALVLVEIIWGAGGLVARFSSGNIIKNLGYLYPFAISTAVMALNVIIIFLFLPETVKRDTNTKQNEIGFWKLVKHSCDFCTCANDSHVGRSRSKLVVCVLILILSLLANSGRSNIDTLYKLNEPFCWNSIKIGWYGTIEGLTQQIAALGLVRIFQIGLSDISIAVLGTVSNAACSIQEALAPNDVILFLAPVVGFGSMFTSPMMRSTLSIMTSSDNQGSLFSGLASIETICNLTGSLTGNGIYAATVEIYRGFAFFVFVFFNFISAVLLLILKTSFRENKVSTSKTENVTDIQERSIKDN